MSSARAKFGAGSQVWAFAHGVDERIVEPPKARKSVGAECNWGIRFTSDGDALTFMDNLAGELSTRMKGIGLLFRAQKHVVFVKKCPQRVPPHCSITGSTVELMLRYRIHISVPPNS